MAGRVPLARRNLLADPRRLAASALAVGMAVMLILLLDGLWAGVRSQVTRYEDEDLRQAGALFETGFDAEDPLHTPRGLAPGPMAVENLARAAKVLERAGFALDVSLGELQHSNKRGGRIPIHGGIGGYEGVENVVFYRENTTTLEPAPEVAALVEGSRVLRTDGYPITYGTSFIMALEFRDDGPHAQAFLTYSESGDRDSPHFVDQTELFSEKAWRPILYGEADIAADPQLVEKTVSAEKGP